MLSSLREEAEAGKSGQERGKEGRREGREKEAEREKVVSICAHAASGDGQERKEQPSTCLLNRESIPGQRHRGLNACALSQGQALRRYAGGSFIRKRDRRPRPFLNIVFGRDGRRLRTGVVRCQREDEESAPSWHEDALFLPEHEIHARPKSRLAPAGLLSCQ